MYKCEQKMPNKFSYKIKSVYFMDISSAEAVRLSVIKFALENNI